MTGQKQYPKTYRFRPNPTGKPYQPDLANKERDLETARWIQRRLLFPKFGFLTGFLPLLIAMVYEKLTGGSVSEGFIIFGFCYVFTVWPLSIGLTLLFGSCPYCHKTQGLNGRVYRPRNFHLARCIAVYHEMYPLRRTLISKRSGSCLPSAGRTGKGYLKNFQVAF